MTIKMKLFLNVIIVAIIVGTIATTSYVSMGFIKTKLTYLTEKSTPFQLKTVEFERTVQVTTADLVKVGASRNMGELAQFRSEAEKSLAGVKNAQDSLESMSAEKYSAYESLKSVSDSLSRSVEGSLKAEEDARVAGEMINKRINEAMVRLKNLDSLVKALQVSSSASYITAVDARNVSADKLPGMETVKARMKDVIVVLLQSQKGDVSKKHSEAKALISNILQNGTVKHNQTLKNDTKLFATKTDEYFTALTNKDLTKAESLNTELNAITKNIFTVLNSEIESTEDLVSDVSEKQGVAFNRSNLAINALSSNAELVAYGTSVEALAIKLFTVTTADEINAISATINTQYTKIAKSHADLERSLKKIKSTKELSVLNGAISGLNSIRTALFSKDGVTDKLKNEISMREESSREISKLRNIVVKQAEKSRETVSNAQGEQEKSLSAVNNMIRKSLGLILTIGIAAIILGLAFGGWIYKAVSGPLMELLKTAESIASGDLRGVIQTDRKDEIGKVQAAMATMVSNLHDIALKIGEATDTLANSSEELSLTSSSLEKGTDDQTGRIEQSAIAMTQMSQTINEVSDNANTTAGTAATMKKAAETGRQKMHTAVEELNLFADTIKSSALEVEKLGVQSQEITGIVSLISDIADQTNLLALNAAIEAARAGDQGRGFAVVADEVRKLAAKTSEATEEIVHSVTAMRSGVESAVKLIQDESSSVDRVVSIVNESAASIDEIVGNMENISDMVDRIAVAAQEQSATSDDISNGMNSIAEVAKQIKTAFVDVKKSSENLASTAAGLNETAKWFKV
ncbi:MAG: methyl-accepting chemotaxis protein [Desulfuromonadaceae bacterium]|nr:methyl-accepting chemotaxis protein [Desulfuromonadaceae bacterium]